MANSKVFYSKTDNPAMINAYEKAQETFKYFWRELSWEHRRIVPALELACVKIAFTQNMPNSTEPVVEHMWINGVGFDGETVTGKVINNPNELTNVKKAMRLKCR